MNPKGSFHLDYSERATQRWLLEESGLDPIVAEAPLADETLPRIVPSGDGLLVILRGPSFLGTPSPQLAVRRIRCDARVAARSPSSPPVASRALVSPQRCGTHEELHRFYGFDPAGQPSRSGTGLRVPGEEGPDLLVGIHDLGMRPDQVLAPRRGPRPAVAGTGQT